MKRRSLLALMITGSVLLAQGSSVADPSAAPPAAPAAKPGSPSGSVDGLKINGSIHSIQLPDPSNEPQLPKGPLQPLAQAFCITCHTPQYVMIQPRLSRATWLAEVTKMRTSFSAPIPEEMVNQLVDYLVSVRGTEGK